MIGHIVIGILEWTPVNYWLDKPEYGYWILSTVQLWQKNNLQIICSTRDGSEAMYSDNPPPTCPQ